MLNTNEITEYLAEVRQFAEVVGKSDELREKLDYLRTYACTDENDVMDETKTRCNLYKDFAPYSFYFVMHRLLVDGTYSQWFNGGLIFHGTHDGGGDGGMPTLSVSLTPQDGWSIHT